MAAKMRTTAAEELERATADLIKGVRDPDAMKKACAELDHSREQLRKKVGQVDLAVELTHRDE